MRLHLAGIQFQLFQFLILDLDMLADVPGDEIGLVGTLPVLVDLFLEPYRLLELCFEVGLTGGQGQVGDDLVIGCLQALGLFHLPCADHVGPVALVGEVADQVLHLRDQQERGIGQLIDIIPFVYEVGRFLLRVHLGHHGSGPAVGRHLGRIGGHRLVRIADGTLYPGLDGLLGKDVLVGKPFGAHPDAVHVDVVAQVVAVGGEKRPVPRIVGNEKDVIEGAVDTFTHVLGCTEFLGLGVEGRLEDIVTPQ